jgi:hypothetical protein
VEAILKNDTLVVFTALTVMFVTPWLAFYWHKVRVSEAAATLKLEMVRRGMSAHEIRAVLDDPAPVDADRRERFQGRVCRRGRSF